MGGPLTGPLSYPRILVFIVFVVDFQFVVPRGDLSVWGGLPQINSIDLLVDCGVYSFILV